MEKNTLSFDATIMEVNEEVKTKTNGKEYVTAIVQFTSGKLSGKKYFAQRTLGENKAAITVGQSVKCIMNMVDVDGVKRPFFEISTSKVDDVNDLLAALG